MQHYSTIVKQQMKIKPVSIRTVNFNETLLHKVSSK